MMNIIKINENWIVILIFIFYRSQQTISAQSDLTFHLHYSSNWFTSLSCTFSPFLPFDIWNKVIYVTISNIIRNSTTWWQIFVWSACTYWICTMFFSNITALFFTTEIQLRNLFRIWNFIKSPTIVQSNF